MHINCIDVIFPSGTLVCMAGRRSLQEYFAEAVTNWGGTNETELMNFMIASIRMLSSVDDPKRCHGGIMSTFGDC